MPSANAQANISQQLEENRDDSRVLELIPQLITFLCLFSGISIVALASMRKGRGSDIRRRRYRRSTGYSSAYSGSYSSSCDDGSYDGGSYGSSYGGDSGGGSYGGDCGDDSGGGGGGGDCGD